jgi:hypothetical protein
MGEYSGNFGKKLMDHFGLRWNRIQGTSIIRELFPKNRTCFEVQDYDWSMCWKNTVIFRIIFGPPPVNVFIKLTKCSNYAFIQCSKTVWVFTSDPVPVPSRVFFQSRSRPDPGSRIIPFKYIYFENRCISHIHTCVNIPALSKKRSMFLNSSAGILTKV